MNYLMLNNKKINLTDTQVEEIKKSFGFANLKLANIPVGDTCKIGDYEFIVLEHSKDTTAVITKELYIENSQFGTNNNNFADENCIVRQKLKEFSNKISAVIGENNLITHTVDLTSDDGLKDYGKISVKMSLLTCKLYRRYVYILDKFKILKWWWLATAYSTSTHNDKDWVKCVSPHGNINYHNYSIGSIGVRPFCILNSNIFVSK